MAITVDAPWMEAPATRKVVEALSADGADVRFVGGCVRDALLGRESTDIDLGTPDRPERVMALLQRACIESHTIPRGIAHGTVAALAGGKRHEITTLRRDERTDGRHAEVAFTDDWREDAARRDFSFNAMSMTPDGTLHDYFGGQADLTAGRVRFVGDPATRIAEDHLRLLRFFRFFAWYGRGAADAAALKACAAAVDRISTLSGGRMRAELMKLLAAPDPTSSVRAMWDTGVLARLLPEARRPKTLALLVPIEDRIAEPDPIRRLAALIVDTNYTDIASPVIDGLVTGRWLQTAADTGRLYSLTSLSTSLLTNLDRGGQRALIYRHGQAHFRDVVLLAWAKRGESEAVWRAMLETADAWESPALPITGADLLARGVPEGPEVGDLLRAVEDWWIEHDFAPDRAALLDKLAALVAARPEE